MPGLDHSEKTPHCPKCSAAHPARMRRQGIAQRFIMPYVGLYPWKCGSCGHSFVAHERGMMRKHRRTAETAAHTSTQTTSQG